MTIKIENKPLAVDPSTKKAPEFREFVIALRDLKPGQSFVTELASNHRMAISILQIALDRSFATRKLEGNTFRLGRLL